MLGQSHGRAPRPAGHPGERLELDGREGEAGFLARHLGVVEEPLAEILVRENLPQRSLHRLLSHRRPPRYTVRCRNLPRATYAPDSHNPGIARLSSTSASASPVSLLIAPCSPDRFHATLPGTRQKARRKRPRHSVGRGPPEIRGIDTVRAARGLSAAGRDEKNLARAKKAIEHSGIRARPSYTRPLISSFGGVP
jgi:hypothetical protein